MKRPLWYRTGTELAADIAAGLLSSSEAVEAFISRVESLDGKVNAMVVRDFSRARKRAAEADAALSRGERWGALHGVPMTVKENNDVEGLPSTIGLLALRGTQAASHSAAVQRLVDAGAVILGKTNLPVGVNDVQTYNPVYGCTNNPFALDRTPGGSSGGSAAALAAGMTPLELGGDIGGSIRLPAHCCGVFGLKPTWDVVPTRSGTSSIVASTGDPAGFLKTDLVVKGPMARSPEDLSMLLDVMSGPVAAEARGWSLTLPRPVRKPLAGYRVAVWGDQPDIAPVGADIKAAVHRCVSALRSAGAVVDESARPAFDPTEMFDTYLQLLAAAESNAESSEKAEGRFREADLAQGDSDEAKQARWIGQRHHSWWKAHAARLAMAELWEDFFTQFDFLVTPVACVPAWPHDHSGPDDQPFWKVGQRTLDAEGLPNPVPYHKQVFWAAIATLCHLPSVSFPAGFSEVSGLPVGLQATGPKYSDYLCIEFARALAEEGGDAFRFVPPAGY